MYSYCIIRVWVEITRFRRFEHEIRFSLDIDKTHQLYISH